MIYMIIINLYYTILAITSLRRPDGATTKVPLHHDPYDKKNGIANKESNMFIRSLSTAAVMATLAFSPVFAQTAVEAADLKPIEEIGGRNLGKLNCNVEGGWGLLIGSSKKASCEFVKDDGTTELYSGKLNKIGIDIGKTKDAYMTWVVFTGDSAELGANALAGSYSGVSAEASLGIGLGTNALIGSNGENIGLQPIAIQNNSGLNLAVGLASLSLEPIE